METTILQFSESEELRMQFSGIMKILSNSWSIPVLYELDKSGSEGFNSIMRSLNGVTAKTLSKTLSDLSANNIVDRTVIASKPPRVIYSLSGKGNELVGLIEGLKDWNRRWSPNTGKEKEIMIRNN